MPYIDPAPIKIDYAKYFSLESKNRQRSQLKELRPYFEMPGMISVSAVIGIAVGWLVGWLACLIMA